MGYRGKLGRDAIEPPNRPSLRSVLCVGRLVGGLREGWIGCVDGECGGVEVCAFARVCVCKEGDGRG